MTGMCDRLFEFRDGHVKEYLCDIKEFMEIRKVERSGKKASNHKPVLFCYECCGYDVKFFKRWGIFCWDNHDFIFFI